MPNPIPTSKHMIETARLLRRRSTPAERVLWDALRHRRLNGWHFRRQHPFGRMVVDFYCHAARLAIEVDGPIHDDPEQAAHDDTKTRLLSEHGVAVLRLGNRDVLQDTSRTLSVIAVAVTRRIQAQVPHVPDDTT